MIIDAHCYLSRELPPAELLRVMDEGGVNRTVLFAEAFEPPPAEVPTRLLLSALGPICRARYNRLVEKRDPCPEAGPSDWCGTADRPDNEGVAEAVAAHPDRFIGFVFVNPADPQHPDIMELYLESGFKGVKVHPWLHGFNVERELFLAAKRCGELGVPVLLHLGGSRPTGLSVIDLADRLPATSFILAHAGLPYYSALWRAARLRPNIYFDLSGPYMSAELLRVVASNVPPGRLLFASGGPHGLRLPEGGHSYSAVRSWIEALPLPGAALEAILGGNLRRILSLDDDAWRREEVRARLVGASGTPGDR
ncbi:MAG: amidohydrolase family protein [Bacillota bacterium]